MASEIWLNGKRTAGKGGELAVRNPATGEVVEKLGLASREQVVQAIDGMAGAGRELRHWSSFRRQTACEVMYKGVMGRAEEFAQLMAREAGKPIKTARAEVARATTTFRLAMEEATHLSGEQLPVDVDARSEGYHAVVEWGAAGPCAFLTPFNFPLNLVAHKVAPALAVGCPFVVRPSLKAPLTAMLLGDLLAEAGLPAGAWSVLPSGHEEGDPLITDERVRVLSFTGSAEVGWRLRDRAAKKQVVLELGSNSAVVVEPETDLADALPRITTGAFGYAGQSCISVQRIFLHEAIYEKAVAALVEQARGLKAGDPLQEATEVGPLIDEAAARRVEAWVEEARAAGAQVLCGGKRHGNFYEPTLLAEVPVELKVACEEVFGPVAVIFKYRDFGEALRAVNATRYGLQAGVFTRDLFKARRAFEELDMGGVIINDVPTMRIDAMPYGGVKDSGLGREGVKYAMEHLTERKVMVVRHSGQ